jgi:hypothetical protein
MSCRLFSLCVGWGLVRPASRVPGAQRAASTRGVCCRWVRCPERASAVLSRTGRWGRSSSRTGRWRHQPCPERPVRDIGTAFAACPDPHAPKASFGAAPPELRAQPERPQKNFEFRPLSGEFTQGVYLDPPMILPLCPRRAMGGAWSSPLRGWAAAGCGAAKGPFGTAAMSPTGRSGRSTSHTARSRHWPCLERTSRRKAGRCAPGRRSGLRPHRPANRRHNCKITSRSRFNAWNGAFRTPTPPAPGPA